MRETAHHATRARTAIPAVARLTVNPERLERMWALTPAQRVAAVQPGQLTLGEMRRWAARAPAGEVPIVSTASSSSSPCSAPTTLLLPLLPTLLTLLTPGEARL